MIPMRAAFCAATMMLIATPVLATKQPSEREMLRQEAEHVCYDDAQRLCSEAIPDEARVEACMKAKRAQVSPACGKVMERGMKL